MPAGRRVSTMEYVDGMLLVMMPDDEHVGVYDWATLVAH